MSRLSLLALLVLVLVVCLSLPTQAVARIDLASFFKSASLVSSEGNAAVAVVAEAPVSSPAIAFGPEVVGIRSVWGCYYSGWDSNQIQCGLGQSITLLGDGFTAAATVTVDNGRFACTDVSYNGASALHCTLPTSVSADRLGIRLTINVTVGSETSHNYMGSVTLSPEPVFPTIAAIKGCIGGFSGGAVTGCRQNSQLILAGPGIYNARTPVVIRLGSYSCYNAFYRTDNTVSCTVPSVLAADINEPLAVTMTFDGHTATYASTLTTWGKLALTNATGCTASSTGPRNCHAGNVITITGTGFNLGPQGDPNDLRVTVGDAACTSFNVLSNTAITCVLPESKKFLAYAIVHTSGTMSGPLDVYYATSQ